MVRFVDELSFSRSIDFEEMLTRASKDLGIIFASVAAVPVEGGKSKEFKVVVGVRRNRTKEMVLPVLTAMFASEQENGLQFTIEIHKGTGTHQTVSEPAKIESQV